jgi:DNA-3-methyladenine glycosylase
LWIEPSWLSRSATEVAPDLIGCTLIRQTSEGEILRGVIVETEAYTPDDPAMHAYRRKTTRNQVMFERSGIAYVYRIYGIYHCLNVVTDLAGIPSAVLIRALALETIPSWIDDPKELAKPHRIAAGPGKLCRSLQIDTTLNGTPLAPGQPMWLEHRTSEFQAHLNQQHVTLRQTTRIGLTQGQDLPWRWYLSPCAAVSKKG